MIYVALLRGINVGGNNKVDMKQLKAVFESVGMSSVTTYINSGNVIFQNYDSSPEQIVPRLEKAIEDAFGFRVKVLLRDLANIERVIRELPDSWKNDNTMKCDVMFLWEEFDDISVLSQLTIRSEIDDVKYVPGAVLWRVDRPNVIRSGMMKIVGTELYRHMTIRNCNTTRKLFELMKATAEKNQSIR